MTVQRYTRETTLRKLSTLSSVQLRDPNQFKSSPLGPGFLTRRERYQEVRWALEDRLEAIHRRDATISEARALVKRWIIGYPGLDGLPESEVVYASSQDAALARAENITRARGWDVQESRVMGDTWAKAYTPQLAWDLCLEDDVS